MEFLKYLLWQSWTWIVNNGLSIASLLVIAILVPRIRRFVLAITASNLSDEQEETKGRRALLGAVVYTVEVVAYFVIGLALLNKFGISLTAAAIPATVISAAIGFGAQTVIRDLLGGLFIIAEKQYGIGDWVEFHSPSGTVQGDVVNMTLRATTIRTLNGEEVIVPNSEARMCVNYSSRWSRAVIEVPVPMTAGGSIKDLEERTIAAAQKALLADAIKDSVLSDLVLQSSTELNAPTAMGLPWTVTMRLMVDCNPGEQWLIERAIRAAVIDTWWDDYGERASQTPFSAAEQITGHLRDTEMLEQINKSDAEPETAVLPATTTSPAAGRTDNENSRSDIPSTGARLDDIHRESNTPEKSSEAKAVEAAEARTGKSFSEMSRRQRLRTILSAGGRARVSTVILFVVLFVLCVLNVSTLESADGPNGWLAPSRFNSEATTTSETSSSQTTETTEYSSAPTTSTTTSQSSEPQTATENQDAVPNRNQGQQSQTETSTSTAATSSSRPETQTSEPTNQVVPGE